SRLLSWLSIGRYPLNAKPWPFMPLAINARSIDEGPTIGTTCISFSCAILTTSAPGSATPGHPASDNTPTSCPCIHGLRYEGNSITFVYLLMSCMFNLFWDFPGESLLI